MEGISARCDLLGFSYTKLEKKETNQTMQAARLVALRTGRSRRWAARMIEEHGILADGQEVRRAGQPIRISAQLAWQGQDAPSLSFRQYAAIDLRAREVLMYHKPVDQLCASVAAVGARSVFHHLPPAHVGKWLQVGRLDVNSSGLLLFTNDGELAYRLMHPKYRIDREYAVRVGPVDRKEVDGISRSLRNRLLKGVRLQDGLARFSDLVAIPSSARAANRWFYITVQSGRRRMVRRLWASQGLGVSRLIRVRYANILLPRNLKPGASRLLTQQEQDALLAAVGMVER